MEKVTCQLYDDHSIMHDALESEKYMAESYNTLIQRTTDQVIRNEFVNLLVDTHQLHINVHDEMIKRGWRTIQTANQQEIDQIKEKYRKFSI